MSTCSGQELRWIHNPIAPTSECEALLRSASYHDVPWLKFVAMRRTTRELGLPVKHIVLGSAQLGAQ